ncbi:hypothetical protein PaG_01382 [Moesziomyces aphidis]|uniref:Uncharacterized protein n=1 Tax=Moesziomyces aphidis TaxID=84754 RepID=W3VTM4_MOEAP|nr:hypothetical protein PaG_01382 [Moesziomyces aphidis]
MADIPLDYGSAEADAAADAAAVPMQDEAMDDGSRPDQASNSRFYALPTDQAVEAGAQRGPAPLTGNEPPTLDDITLMGTEEPTESPDPPAVEGGSDIRLDTLLIEGAPITQLSTSRLFAYLTHYGAQPLGLEWIDDQRCKVVFADERSARLALEYLCPSPASDEMQPVESDVTPLPNIDTLLEYDPDSWHSEFITSLVQPRKAHRVPAKLYTHVERQAALAEQESRTQMEAAVSELPDDVPEIYREMEQEERRNKLESREVRELRKLRSVLWLRHAVTDVDRKESRASTRSQWYKRHGYDAGREIVPKLLQVGQVAETKELFPGYEPSSSEPPRRRDERRSMLDELDSELDRHVASRTDEPERKPGEMMADVVARGDDDLMDRLGARSRRREPRSDSGRWGHDAYLANEDSRRRGRRSRPSATKMDEELDRHARQRHHERELSPSRRDSPSSSHVRVKGRGRMKAPASDGRWDDSPPLAQRMDSDAAPKLLKRIQSNSLASRFT